MKTTVRQMRRYVQKIAKIAALDPVETKLAEDCIIGICKSGSCKVSDIVRALNVGKPLRKEARDFYDGLADQKSEIERLREAWLDFVAPTANNMPFIAVDPSDIIKPYGKQFDFLDVVRDASDREKRNGTGFPTVQIEATNHEHQNLSLWQETFSTKHPDFRGWFDFIARAMQKVLSRLGKSAIWLFDRGFDAGDFYTILRGFDVTWVVRQLQTRNVVFGDDQTMLMRDLAKTLIKPHETSVPYIDKKSHEVKSCPVRFGYAPVRLPGQQGRLWLIVITGLRADDMVLLTNEDIRCAKQAERIVRAYMRRWGIEAKNRRRGFSREKLELVPTNHFLLHARLRHSSAVADHQTQASRSLDRPGESLY